MENPEGGEVMPLDPRQCVVTKPISSAGPTEVDHQRTAELEKFLWATGLYESKEEAGKREDVLGKINQGDHVEEFQPLCEVQSDKATIEITSRYKGKVLQVVFAPGDSEAPISFLDAFYEEDVRTHGHSKKASRMRMQLLLLTIVVQYMSIAIFNELTVPPLKG